ncbi:MAG TPA: class I SAM-dependent methyltransferase family protein [Methanothrix sp.]|nr:class I SAM-dependent methyltransferase family protein [Methanothrix sp.]HPJ84089.1 class I SAM-dependent methyltransferase family protein [Methanothrix sp.]
MAHSSGLKVRRSGGERFRQKLVELGLFDKVRKIRSDEGCIYLPVLDLTPEAAEDLTKIGDFDLVEIEFEVAERKETVEEILGRRAHYEVVGEIAIQDSPDREAAFAILKVKKNVKTVISPITPVEGEYRTRRFTIVAGEEKTATVHKEHGLRYRIDLEKAYFTPRLGTERLRVANLVAPGDVVFDMFAGVGPFALFIAKHGAKVVAVDKNPDAARLLRENAQLNRIDEVEILEGDAGQMAELYENFADHVIMNLPHTASEFLGQAIRIAKDGGVVHYYAIAPEEDLYGRDTAFVEEAALVLGAKVNFLYRGIVRSYAPHQYNIVIDFEVRKP